MKKKILVVGSGDAKQIDATTFDAVYSANSAFTRVLNHESVFVVLSDAMLFTSHELAEHAPISGKSRSASDAFRLAKYALIDNRFFEKVFILDNGNVDDIETALSAKNVTYTFLQKFEFRHRWKLLHRCFGRSVYTTIFMNVPGILGKLRFFAQRVLNRHMHVSFRPSTGIYSIMIAVVENPEAEIFLSGISASSERTAEYATGSLTYNSNIHLLDSVYCRLLTRQNVKFLD